MLSYMAVRAKRCLVFLWILFTDCESQNCLMSDFLLHKGGKTVKFWNLWWKKTKVIIGENAEQALLTLM